MSTHTASTQRSVALSAIDVREGFNSRSELDQKALDALTRSIERRGVLAPLIVCPRSDEDGYVLVAGQRRYAACCALGLMEVAVIVRDVDEQTDGLADAVVENLQRAGLSALEEAQAFGRLLERGLTRKGIAEELSVSPRLVTERLAILALPQDVQNRVGDGTIPTSAVKALGELARIHDGLPAVAVSVVLRPADPDQGIYEDEQTTWADVVADPVSAIVPRYGDEPMLPDGVFVAYARYPLSAFQLFDRAQRAAAQLAEHDQLDADPMVVTFQHPDVQAAEALGAVAHAANGHEALIVGQAVADQLVSDKMIARLKAAKAHNKRQAEIDARYASQTSDGPGAETAEPEPSAEEQEAQRKARRAAERQARVDAHAHNVALGTAVLKQVARLRVDEDAVRVLTAYPVATKLGEIAMRGARYCLPGWFTETAQKKGRVKVEYLESTEAEGKAREFLEGAKTAAEVCGRVMSLLVLAHYADEEALARSNRSFYTLCAAGGSEYVYAGAGTSGVPWAKKAQGLLEGLAEAKLPAPLTAAVRAAREQRAARRAEAEQARQAALAVLLEQAPGLSSEELAERRQAFTDQHGWLSWAEAQQLNQVTAAREPEASAGESSAGDSDEPDREPTSSDD